MELNGGLASTEESLDDSTLGNPFRDSTSINYNAILTDLCSKIEGASYYSGSSSTWFLRGALAKYEEERNTNARKVSFSPRVLTNVLLEKLLLEKDNDNLMAELQQNKDKDESRDEQEVDQQYENYLMLSKALAKDSSKYLPAMAASLSNLVSSKAAIVIHQEFLELWITAIVDDSTSENLYHQLCEDLFLVFQQQYKLRSSNDPLALPTHALSCLVEGDSWHIRRDKSNTKKTKSISPPPTQSTLRRVSVFLRFLSRSESCAALDSDSKQKIALDSGAMEWFLEVLGGESCPIRHEKQRLETSSGLLDLILDDCKMANIQPTSTSMEWLFSPDRAGTVVLFFQQTIRGNLEDWNRHLQTLPLSQEDSPTTNLPPAILRNRKNHDLVSDENRKALDCAMRYIKFIARLPPEVCPLPSVDIAEKASEGSDKNGKQLLRQMLNRHESPFQRLRLVQLLIDEFANSGFAFSATVEKDNMHVFSLKQWLSSPGILTPILEECSKDPFLASSDATDRFINTYGELSWKSRFAKKSMLREAPKALSVDAFKATEAILDSKPKGGRKLLSKMRDRLLGNSTPQGDQYNTFSGENHAIFESKLKQQVEYYDLFDR